MFRSVTQNPPLIIVLLHDSLRLVAFFGIFASAAYYVKILLGDSAALPWLLTLFYAGTALGSSFSARVAGKLGICGASAAGCINCALLHGSCYFFAASLPATALLLFLTQCSFGVAHGLTSRPYSMCGTYGQWKTGEDAKGVAMSFASLSIKLAIAVRVLLITAFLGFIHYNPNERKHEKNKWAEAPARIWRALRPLCCSKEASRQTVG